MSILFKTFIQHFDYSKRCHNYSHFMVVATEAQGNNLISYSLQMAELARQSSSRTLAITTSLDCLSTPVTSESLPNDQLLGADSVLLSLMH